MTVLRSAYVLDLQIVFTTSGLSHQAGILGILFLLRVVNLLTFKFD